MAMSTMTRREAVAAMAGSVGVVGMATLPGMALGAEKKLWATSFLGKKGPALEVERWLGAEPKREGRWILIDFWATWCGPCRKAIPELNTFHKQFGDRLVVIGITDESEEVIRKMKTPVLEYFQAIDTQKRTSKGYGVSGIPHVVILDPEGIVRWEGYPLLDGHELTAKVIEGLLPAKKG
jgi:cytochrome c biogenesis protein CcmG, thiol:disulfide interchange protein DsbE